VARHLRRGPDSYSPRIDEDAVAAFFERRAQRIPELGPTRAVIYQDKHADLAERRDVAERQRLAPLLRLDGGQRLLDIGCGTGRWVDTLGPLVAAYHGIDLSEGLTSFARKRFAQRSHVRFTVASAVDFTLDSIGEREPFNRILVGGLLIYLNDENMGRALNCIRQAIAMEGALLLFREPVAQRDRLTIVDHFSQDLDAEYNAIYRTRDELCESFGRAFGPAGLSVISHGYVFEEDELNNRPETRQEWFLVGAR
jgi:cyclopropane fatty-acyl-phospholipid synthase-like methyltransferase